MHPLLLLSLVSLSLLFFKLVHSIFWVPFKIRRHFRKQGVSGPPYRPLVGNAAEVQRMYDAALSKPMSSSPLDNNITSRVMPHYVAWAAEYGKTFLYWFGTKPVLAFSEPALIKEILMNSDGTFGIQHLNPLAVKWIGNGLVFLEGEKWVPRRRIANQAFSMERVKSWVEDMVESTMKTVENWERILAGREEMEIEVQQEMNDLSSDIIARTAFGSNYEEEKRIFHLHQQHLQLVLPTMKNIYVPGSRFLPTKTNRMMWKLDKETREWIKSLINKNNKQQSRNLVTLLLSAAENDPELDIDKIIEDCKTFYFVGKETTATLITWALILLSAHPEWQDKAREEVLNVCGNSGFPSSDNISDFRIISMVVNETLRLYPPSVFLRRRTTRAAKLGKLSVPAETEVYMAMTAVHHNEEIWGADAHEFNPMRFEKTTPPVGAYFPFAAGPRYCVGQSMALVEARVVLAVLLQRYSFALSPSYVHAPVDAFPLQPQYGAHLVVRKVV